MLKVESPAFNLSAHEENGEIVDQKPFVIRGHHLSNYAQLIRKKAINRYAPSRLAKIMTLNIQRIWQETRYYIQSPHAKYGKDVLGSWNQGYRFEEQYKLALETFSQLPDDHPVEIVEGIPDVICNGCAIGEHCRRLFTDDYVSENIFKNDGEHIDTFLEDLSSLNLPKPTIVSEQAYFSDAEPQLVRRIKTTIGIVRRVLRETDNAFWSQEKQETM